MSGWLAKAFNVDELQITGPAWVTQPGSFYAVTATMPRGTTQSDFLAMFQNLLAERFHLVAHHETKKFPGYELVVEERGPKFNEAPPNSGPQSNSSGLTIVRAGQIPLTEQPMSAFVAQLERRLRLELDNDRTPWVVDKTGLERPDRLAGRRSESRTNHAGSERPEQRTGPLRCHPERTRPETQ
jgi:uncharacterized protein (TIGR03435 family)